MMSSHKIKFIFLFVLILISFGSWSQNEPHPLDGFLENTKESFTGKNTYFHLAGAALTPVIIKSGLDAEVNDTFNDRKIYPLRFPGVVVGYVAPFAVGVPLLVHGEVKSNNESLRASYAVFQASVITLGYVSLLKALTGRPPPDNDSLNSIRDQSEEFNLGFLKRGIVDGWPSGHMATTMAIASTMTHFYPETPWIKWAAYGTSAYMFYVVSSHDEGQMHWFSDAVAGGLMGYAIGSTVGTNMRSRHNKDEEDRAALLPIFDRERTGVQVVWQY
jgi:hypothetical protein